MNRAEFEAQSSRIIVEEKSVKQRGIIRHHNYLFPLFSETHLLVDHAVDVPIPTHTGPAPDKKVVVIIPAYNCWAVTKLCLEYLARFRTRPYRVVVVDNGSSDGTPAFIRQEFPPEEFPWISLICNLRNEGFGKAINKAAALTEEDEDIVILNNDVLVRAGWIEGMIRSAYFEEDVGVVACRLVSPNGKTHHAGAVMNRNFTWDANIYGRELPNTNLYIGRWYPHGVMFACAYIPNPAWQALGGLDEEYFAYLEDSDTCFRLRELGFKVVYDGSVTAFHYNNTTTRECALDLGHILRVSLDTFKKKWALKVGVKLSDRAVMIRGFWHGMGGYCCATRELARALDLGQIPIWVNEPLTCINGNIGHEPVEEDHNHTTNHLECMAVDDPSIAPIVYNLSLPNKWLRIPGHLPGDHLNIGSTMLEVDGIPNDWVTMCNLMDAVTVPTEFNITTFRKSGVTVPMKVVPIPINTHIYHPYVRPLVTTGNMFRILSVFEWGARKAPEMLLEQIGKVAQICKKKGFEVELIIRSGWQICEHLDEIAETSRRYDFKITTLAKIIPELLMPSLYKACHLFVVPTRGEGFGMPIVEAMATGVPVVTSPNSAVGTFFDESVGYPVNWEWAPAHAYCPFYEGFNWAEPDPDHLRNQVLRAIEDVRSNAKCVGEKTSRAVARVSERFSYESVAKQFRARIAELSRECGKEIPAWTYQK